MQSMRLKWDISEYL